MGVVPACRSLDCVSVFCNTVADGVAIANVLETSTNDADPTWHAPNPLALQQQLPNGAARFRFAVPQDAFLGFDGPGGDVVKQGTTCVCSGVSIPHTL